MEKSITEKNHYNPCFWTACWNSAYLSSLRKSDTIRGRPRDEEVFNLNLKSNKIIKCKTKNVFYEKRAGIAEIKKEDALDYCNRAFPNEYDGLRSHYEEHPKDHFLDFENHFTCIEDLYKPYLENVIVRRAIESIQEKTFLSYFIFTQIFRNHNHWLEAVSVFEQNKMAKFEMILGFKQDLTNRDSLIRLISPYLLSTWKLYRTKENKFPLSDNPVLIRPLHIFLPLAPDLLLEVELNKKTSLEEICSHFEEVPSNVYEEVIRRTIENSSREIVFGKKELLEDLQKNEIVKQHLKNIALANKAYSA